MSLWFGLEILSLVWTEVRQVQWEFARFAVHLFRFMNRRLACFDGLGANGIAVGMTSVHVTTVDIDDLGNLDGMDPGCTVWQTLVHLLWLLGSAG